MRKSICGSVLLIGAFLLTEAAAWAQQAPKPGKQLPVSVDLAVTYSPERGELAPGNCGCFWLQGAGVDAGVTLWKGLGVAAGISSGVASNIKPGVDIRKIQFGPRYTHTAWTGHNGSANRSLQLFGQGLFGGVHAYGGIFPGTNGTTTTAGSYEVQAGGGLNLSFQKSLGFRLFEADYVRTALPNNGSNIQNDLRLSFGVTFHLGKH